LINNNKKAEALEYIHKYSVLLLGIAIPATVGLNLVGPNLISLIIDDEFQTPARFLLPWISFAIFFLGIQVCYFNIAFQIAKKNSVCVKIAALIAVVNLALNYLLIPSMSIKGAAIATLLSFALGCLVSAIIGRKYFALPLPWNDLLKILITSLLMAVCLWNLIDLRGIGWLLVQLFIGIITVFVMMLVFNVLGIRKSIIEYLKP